MPPNTSSPFTGRPEKRGRGRPPIHKKDETGRPIIELNPDGSRVVPVQKYEKKVRAGRNQSAKPTPIYATRTSSASVSVSRTATMWKRKAKSKPEGCRNTPNKRVRKSILEDEDEDEDEEDEELELELDDDDDETAFVEPPQAHDSEWEEQQEDEEEKEAVTVCLTGSSREKGKDKLNEETEASKAAEEHTKEAGCEDLGLYIRPGLLLDAMPEVRVRGRETGQFRNRSGSPDLQGMTSVFTERIFNGLPPAERWVMALEQAGVVRRFVAEGPGLFESPEVQDLMVDLGMRERTDVCF